MILARRYATNKAAAENVTAWRRIVIAAVCYFVLRKAIGEGEPIDIVLSAGIGLYMVVTAAGILYRKWSITLWPF